MPADNNTILLYGLDFRFQEKVAAGAITPGMLIELTSADEVQAHSAAAGQAFPTFAAEDSLQGREITVAYAAAEIVKYVTPHVGAEVLAIANAAIAIGAEVESAGNGKLQTRTTGERVGIAKSAAGALDDRFAVEIG
jgi:hypothetical protein